MPASLLSRPALLLTALLLLSGCHKEKVDPIDQLPPATTTGADTFGYLLNGQPVFGSGRNRVRGDWTLPGHWSCIVSAVGLDVLGTPQPGTYALVPQLRGPASGRIIYKGKLYDYRSVVSGTLHLTRLDRAAAICSGEFNLTIEAEPGDTLRITNGRFDCHMDL